MTADNLGGRDEVTVGDERCAKGGLVLLATGDSVILSSEREEAFVLSAMTALHGEDPRTSESPTPTHT